MSARITAMLSLALLCATSDVVSAQGRTKTAVKAPAEPPIFTLERTQCKGQCAEYKLSFFSDGIVVYDGKANSSKAGQWHATVDRRTLDDIQAGFKKIDFFALNGAYGGGLSQNPVAITSWRLNDKVKTVSHDVGSPFSPADLTTLEDRMDAAVQSVAWER